MQLTTSSLGASPCVTHVIELCGTNCFIASDDDDEDSIRFLEAANDEDEDLSGVCTIFIPFELTCSKVSCIKSLGPDSEGKHCTLGSKITPIMLEIKFYIV